MSCDVGKATEGLENELWSRWNDGKVGELLATIRSAAYINRAFFQLHTFFWRVPQSFKMAESLSINNATWQIAREDILNNQRWESLKSLKLSLIAFLFQYFKNLIFSKMAQTIFIKFCGLIVHSNPNNDTTSQLILQPIRYFTFTTVHSPILLSFLLRHKLFT